MYLPFGGTRWESGTTPTDFQFTGQRKEASFGLYDYHARYYDPLIGRFVSADAVVPGAGKPQALNRYAYVFNNPLKYVDPSGHEPSCDPREEDCHDPSAPNDEELAKRYNENPGPGCDRMTMKGCLESSQIWYDYLTALSRSYKNKWGTLTADQKNFYRVIAEEASKTSLAIRLLTGVNDTATRETTAMGSMILADVMQAGMGAGKPCSFSAETVVATLTGTQTISTLRIGDMVLAYNEASGVTGSYTLTAVLAHDDPIIVYVTIDSEQLETTPEHPFYTGERGWVIAGELRIGDHIRNAKGDYGTVQATAIVQRSRRMYNLTVAEAHTFFVGSGEWLVHNDCGKGWLDAGYESAHHRAQDHFAAHGGKGTPWNTVEQYTKSAEKLWRKYEPALTTQPDVLPKNVRQEYIRATGEYGWRITEGNTYGIYTQEGLIVSFGKR